MKKIVSIVALLLALDAQTVSAIQAPPTDDTGSSFFCPTLTQTLKRGMRDVSTSGQVSELQNFIADYFDLAEADAITGFFGRTTQKYLIQFQQQQGLPAYGIAGVLTRAKIAEVCTQDGQTPNPQCPVFQRVLCGAQETYAPGANDSRGCVTQGRCVPGVVQTDFSASVKEGGAPLSVTFSAFVGGRQRFAVNFGDGSALQNIACFAPADACRAPGTLVHTYQKPGTYVATLIRQYGIMELQPGDRMNTTPINSVTIRVTDPAAEQPDTQCKVWFDGCNTCMRSVVGGALACTKMACITDTVSQNSRPYCKEYFGTSNDKPPAITGFSGPTQLRVSENGTWSINATDPEGGQLSYAIDWGDIAWTTNGRTTGSESASSFVQATTFTHVYTAAGTYTVSITVRDRAGGIATSSATVTVGETPYACPALYKPVCGERRVCSTGTIWNSGGSCWGERKTYSNTCTMAADTAAYLYDGECNADTVSSYTPPANCSSWYDGCNSCGRSKIGGESFCTQKACLSGQTRAGYCTGYFDATIGDIAVEVTGMRASITSPQQLLAKSKITANQFGLCGYTIQWGDGITTPVSGNGSCGAGLVHTYATKGTYTVQAALTHQGNTDGTVVDWKGFTHVVVPTLRCTAQGMSYTEGQSPVGNCIDAMAAAKSYQYSAAALFSLRAEQPAKVCLSDAKYVCREGVWKIEGGMIAH